MKPDEEAIRPDTEEVINQVGVEKLAALMRQALGPDLFDACQRMGIDAEDILRYMPLAEKFRKGRARQNLTIKEVAAKLKAPQYKIRAVEDGKFGRIDADIFQKYCRFLQLDEYVESWTRKNPALAGQLFRSEQPAGQAAGQAAGQVLQFKITLKGTKPPVWRRIQVPAGYSFWDLHVAIQDAMGWLDYHLHQFHIFDKRTQQTVHIGIPDDEFLLDYEIKAGWEAPIKRWLAVPGQKINYLYDFGDDWQHTIVLEKILPEKKGVSYPRCLGGRRKCPPEDCGGTCGYRDFLRIISDPDDEEHSETLEWVGGGYDPDDFNAGRVKFDDPAQRYKIAFEDE
ncbi:MAG: helix-turn-helix domain-containing protein [Thermoleophilia bacterium]|nr:helix-turn-helix domain-containing protein [Thermoleophilia bacterium]